MTMSNTTQRLLSRVRPGIWAAAITAMAVALPAHAQMPGGGQSMGGGAGHPQQNQQMKEFQQARMKMQQLQQQLGQIQRQTLESHPELQEKEEDFRSKMVKVMKDNGHTPEADLERLKELRSQLTTGDEELSDDKRKSLMREFRQTNRSFQQAQREAMQNSEVQQAREELSNAVLTTMKEENPETETLMKKMKQTQKKLQQIRSSVTPSAPSSAPPQ